MRYYIALFVVIVGGAMGAFRHPVRTAPAPVPAPVPAIADLPPGAVIASPQGSDETIRRRIEQAADDSGPVDSVRIRGADGVEREIRDPEQIARLRKAQKALWEANAREMGYSPSPRHEPDVNFAPGAPMVDPAGRPPTPTSEGGSR